MEMSMHFEDQAWQALAARAEKGDAAAALQLQKEMEPHMLRIVRRAMRVRNSSSPLDERIRRNAQHAAILEQNSNAVEDEPVLRSVAQRLCQMVIGRFRPQPISNLKNRETVRI